MATQKLLSPWRLIESPHSDIFAQMALDRELFEEFIQNQQALPTLRIYRVNQPRISVGHSWRESEVGADPTICIRPTGGGFVRHGNDLIYSVIARSDTFPTFHQVRTSYLSFHEAIQAALKSLGVESRLFRCDEAKARDRHAVRNRLDPCFENPIATDVLVNERKIAGGAQRRKKTCFLHQGSVQILSGISFELLHEAFLGAFEKKFDVAWSQVAGVC